MRNPDDSWASGRALPRPNPWLWKVAKIAKATRGRSDGRDRVPDPGGSGGDAGVQCASVQKNGARDPRHTRATCLLLYGVPVTLVSKRLGQAKVATTLDMYSHTLPGFEPRAVESIGAAQFG